MSATLRPRPPKCLPPPRVIPHPHHPLFLAYTIVHYTDLGGDDYECAVRSVLSRIISAKQTMRDAGLVVQDFQGFIEVEIEEETSEENKEEVAHKKRKLTA